ncbi:MAG: hypothetical protein KGI38_06540 [Thaumarchaeota archaeon]|nr:hypothetical protein [Nitrososphaerota archaeon]
MSDEAERGPQIIDAHQELVRHVEQTAGRIRALSMLTIMVAAVLAVSYLYQLVLPLAGTTAVSVNLTDPVNVGTELVVLLLVVLWLYVGLRDLRFSSRLSREIRLARSKEEDIQDRIS